jgi:hypothetical protein
MRLRRMSLFHGHHKVSILNFIGNNQVIYEESKPCSLKVEMLTYPSLQNKSRILQSLTGLNYPLGTST